MCQYCKDDAVPIVEPDVNARKYGWDDRALIIKDRNLVIDNFFDGRSVGYEVPISFCPMCGRQLRETKK